MKKTLMASLIALAAAPAIAEPSCTPGAEQKPIWESIKSFEDQGGKVLSFKINGGGCYEIYGKLEGTKMEVFFDPNTGEALDRIKA